MEGEQRGDRYGDNKNSKHEVKGRKRQREAFEDGQQERQHQQQQRKGAGNKIEQGASSSNAASSGGSDVAGDRDSQSILMKPWKGKPHQKADTGPVVKERWQGKTHTRKKKNKNAGAGAGGGHYASQGSGGSATYTTVEQPTEARQQTAAGGKGATPRLYTLSIAIPGSIVDNAQSKELKTYLVGQIARAAAIFQVDEIVVYDDKMGGTGGGIVRDDSVRQQKNNSNVFMARLLQYIETPQYLRKALFPMHPDLRFAGLLNPLDSPHHVRADEFSLFREGVVTNKEVKEGAGSLVDIGTRKDARIDVQLKAGVRVTVRLDERDPNKRAHAGKAVAPSAPREELGLYWGYQTRLADGMAQVLSGCPFADGYDLTIGTSERGQTTVEDADFKLPPFKHCLVVFGGVQGIEASIDSDESMPIEGPAACELFDMWVNTCPSQGSRTIRSEEAVLLSLARLRGLIAQNIPPSC